MLDESGDVADTNVICQSVATRSFTWNSREEFDGVPVSVEAELRLRHGAVRYERPGCHTVVTRVTVNSDHPTGSSCSGCSQSLLVVCKTQQQEQLQPLVSRATCTEEIDPGVHPCANVLSERGTEMMTPFPVPIHSLLTETRRAVIRTNENPSFPVPANERQKH